MKRINPSPELEEAMVSYYNRSDGYLGHLKRKRGSFYNYYTYFLSKYLSKLEPGSKVLEVGCGDGYAAHVMSKMFPQLEFVAADVSGKFIEFAKKNFTNSNLKYVVGDSLNMQFGDNTFSEVVSTDVIEHIPDVPRWLDESRRVLKANGLLIVVTGNHFSPIQPFLDIIRFETRPPFA